MKFSSIKYTAAAAVLCAGLFAGSIGSSAQSAADTVSVPSESAGWRSRPANIPDDKYRTYYEVFIYSFFDSDGDGIGDLNGLREKLDYLNDGDDTTDTDLGINGIWLMPIMPSPTYHKYDSTDYMSIDPQYGTLEDFQTLISDCHERGIRVIIDLALNHTSSEHPWFLEATEYLASLPVDAQPDASECPYVDYYNFTQESGSGFSPVSGTQNWYYESRFWSEMPDLNLEQEGVRAEFEAIADFWLDLGVDGFRLDAVKEYVTGSESTNVEILTWFNEYIKEKNPEAYIVCECWMAKEYYAAYYASGVDSMFNFDFADKSGVIANVSRGTSPASAYGSALVNNAELYASYKEDYIDAPFYTNHDMGRSAGYYAGDLSEAQTKLGHALNLLMSGNAFLYYGEELGMKGSGDDENKRAPMYWSTNADSDGMCDGPEGMDNIKMKFGSLEEQANDVSSIYNYVKDVIRLRNQNPAIARGQVTYHEAYSGEQLCVISKEYEGTELLIVFNTSAESATADLSGLSVGNAAVSELIVLGELLTGEKAVSIQGNTVTMPSYSVLVLGL